MLMLRNSCIQAREQLTRQRISKSRFLEGYPRLLLRNFRSKTYVMAKLTKNVLLFFKNKLTIKKFKGSLQLIHRTFSVIYVHLTCGLQGRAKIVSFRLGY